MAYKGFVPHYSKEDREHMRALLKKGARIIDLIAEDIVPFGSRMSAGLIDSLASEIGYENTDGKDDDALEQLLEALVKRANERCIFSADI